jgi:hypothetical protein
MYVGIPSNSPLWGFSEAHAINIKNNSWQKGTKSSKTPRERLTGIKANLPNYFFQTGKQAPWIGPL